MTEKWSVLEISDGTTSVDLLRGCLKLQSWKPQTTDLKDSGIWGESPFDSGREMLDSHYTDVIETFSLVASANSQKTIAYFTRLIRQLLVNARQYKTTNWVNTPVWIEARAYGETVSRYSRIKSGRIPEDDEIFGVDFAEGRNRHVIMKNLALVIEREPFWCSEKPTQSTGIAVSSQAYFSGLENQGREATTLQEVFIANKHNVSNITHVYAYDDSLASFSSNLYGAALPVAFLPASPAASDIAYFGTNTALANSGPFDNVIFDITQAQFDLTIVWEYWNGAWVSLTVTDNTGNSQPFDLTGVHGVHWIVPTDWTTTAVNGVTGYWVRARVTAIGGAVTTPKQGNRDFYTVTNPFVDIAVDQIGGDDYAQAKLAYLNTAYTAASVLLNVGDFLVASRSLSRGSDFTPYINFSDEQNNVGIVVTPTGAAGGAFVNSVNTPTGRCIEWTPTGVEGLSKRADYTIGTTLFSHYFGQFHVFIRCRQTSGTLGDIGVQFQLKPSGGTVSLFTSETKYTQRVTTTIEDVLDFGIITLPPGKNSVTWGTMQFDIYCSCADAGAPHLQLIDMIFMPIDEWIGDANDITAGNNLINNELVIDGTNPKNLRVAIVRNASTLAALVNFRLSVNAPMFLQHDSAQRLWFFQRKISSGAWASWFEFSGAVQLFKNQQYFSMRGET